MKITSKITTWIFLSIISLSVFSCGNDDNNNGATEPTITLEKVANVLGGESVINGISTMKYQVNGVNWEYEEEEPNVPNPINTADFSRTVTTELNSRKLRFDYTTISRYYPFNYEVGLSSKVINDKQGSYSGDAGFGSHFFGASNANPVRSSGIESGLKIQKLSNPLEMLKELLASNPLTLSTSSSYAIPTGVAGLNIELVIDPTTFFPLSAKVMEVDFVNGDTELEVSYTDWVTVGTTMYPSKLSYFYNGGLVRTEELSTLELNPNLASDTFTPEITTEVYDTEQGEFGVYSSWWYERFLSFGGPIDQPLNTGAEEITSAAQVVGPNLKIIGRADVGYWSVALKTSTGVVIVEPSLNQRWTRSIIDAVKTQAYPGENIEAVIATHTHFDHFGGVRELAQETGKVYIGEDGVSYTEGVLSFNSTLLPDTLTTNPASVSVEGVSEVAILDGGTIEIHPLDTSTLGTNPHGEDMVAVYVPEYEAFIVADMFNSGGFVAIAQGFTVNNFNAATKAVISERANYLLDYIDEKGLTVSRVIAIHNGVGTFADLEFMASL